MSCGWDFRISCGSIIQNWVNHYSFAITMLVVIILNVSWCWKNMLKAVAKSYDCSISKKRKEKIKNYCSIFDKWANQRLWQPSHSIAPTGLFLPKRVLPNFSPEFPDKLFSQIQNSWFLGNPNSEIFNCIPHYERSQNFCREFAKMPKLIWIICFFLAFF